MSIEVTNQESQIAVAIKKTAVTMDESAPNALVNVIDECYGKIMGYLAELGKQPASAPYICYSNGSEDFTLFDLEMGIPVDAEVPPKGELYMSKTYEGKAIATTHKGPYKTLETAYVALMDYAKSNSVELAGVYYDFYISNPADTPEDELLTRVVFPVK